MLAKRRAKNPDTAALPAERRILDAEPPRDMQVSICIDAWHRLDTARPLGMRPLPVKGAAPILVPFAGAIPWPAIEQYGRFHGLGREAVVLLVEVIEQLDYARAKKQNEEARR